MKNSFEQSLDHAPVIALIDVDNAEQAFRAGTACWAGGFRLVAIAAGLDAAPGIVSALGARADLLVGLWNVQTPDELKAFEPACVAFMFGSPELTNLERPVASPFVPIVTGPSAVDSEWSQVCFAQTETLGGATFVGDYCQGRSSPELFVQGRIGGDETASYLDAGARALILTNAMMSPNLLKNGDYRSIRNYAAAVHQQATHLSRNAQEKTA